MKKYKVWYTVPDQDIVLTFIIYAENFAEAKYIFIRDFYNANLIHMEKIWEE